MNLLGFLGVYIIGFIITLIILIKYGKSKFGIDYDQPKTYVNYDDYDSNAQAFICFSLGWVIVVPIALIFGAYMGLLLLVQKLIDLTDKENE